MTADFPRRVGVVDCGTNTFTLHIAECTERGEWNSVFRQRRFVRLGLDSFRSGRLSPQRFRRGLDVLASFRETAGNCGVQHYRAFGCSAIRDASNGPEFAKAAGRMGWEIEVLDGPTEAHWIHLGVADSMAGRELGGTSMLTVDIGGGSVELIHWTQQRVLGRWSLDLGVARLTDWIKPADPLRRSDVHSIQRISDAAWAPVLQALSDHPPRIMVGTSGAFNTLMTLQDPQAPWRHPRKADEFDREQLMARCDALTMKPMDEIREIEGVHPDRVQYMAVACALIQHLLVSFPTVDRVFRSRHTLAEGVICDAADQGSRGVDLPTGWRPFHF
jgi:exopolyphosphatase/guanosine-5'-triphosphate,3'-diphosphate pyrophosphatase